MIPFIVLFIFVIGLAVLFFFQEKRQQSFLKQLQAVVDRLNTVEANTKVLAQNDATLLKDMKMMLHEFKNTEKKVKFHDRG